MNKNKKGIIVLILNIVIMICNTVIGKIDAVNVENVPHESQVGIIAHEFESLYMEV